MVTVVTVLMAVLWVDYGYIFREMWEYGLFAHRSIRGGPGDALIAIPSNRAAAQRPLLLVIGALPSSGERW